MNRKKEVMTKIKNLLETSPLNTLVNVGFDQYNEFTDKWDIVLEETNTVSDLLNKNNDTVHQEIKNLMNSEVSNYLSKNKLHSLIVGFNKDFDYLGKKVTGIQIIEQL